MKLQLQPKKLHGTRAYAARKWLCLAVALLAAGRSVKLLANPTGMTVRLGSATAQTSGAQLNVTVSQVAFLNWSSFDIQAGETTTFIQPSANSVVFNEIGGASASQIYGNLNANGTVILANANGFYFGPNSMIKVGGDFIATTAPITPDFGAGSSWTFTGMPPLASIINYGSIQVGNGRSLFLIAEDIQNNGSLNAPGGNIGLAAGQTVLVSERPDGRGLSANIQVPVGAVNNLGQITADAGTIALQAQTVNQNGIIQANSVQDQNGVIELVASDSLTLGANSQILAHGDDSTSGSAGGNVTLKSGNTFGDAVGSQIFVTGGAQGGNGGNVEISAPNVLSLNSGIDARATAGWTAGKLLLDPDYIILDTSGSGSAGSGTVLAGSNPGSTLDLNVNNAFANLAVSQIILQAAYDITLAGSTSWNLSGTIGANFGGVTSGQLTLEAGRNIIFGDGSLLVDFHNWSVTLQAGYDFVNHVVQSGNGSIFLNNNSGDNTGGGWIQTAGGNINLIAGQDILLGGGSVFTTGGGGIFVDAMAGSINLGSWNGGTSFTRQTTDYLFGSSGVTPNTVLGGFSTAAGGDVTLIAGNNVDSTASVTTGTWQGESGAYGAGNVTVIAGNQITGNYLVANGVGTLLAGVLVSSAQASQLQNRSTDPVGAATALNELETAVQQAQNPNGNIGISSAASGLNPVTLSLISGSWNAWAANSIYLKEVNNPDGAFNAASSFLFSYASDAAVSLWAGNAIELTGNNLHRVASQKTPIVYAPILSLNAGVGGILIDKTILLYPSSQGSLHITTRNGGNLTGKVNTSTTALTGITMSDGNPADYQTFTSGYSSPPLHYNANDPYANPVVLDISGSIGSFGLVVPTFAQITVDSQLPYIASDGSSHYGTYNFGFQGRNLSPLQTTFIDVTGDIAYPDYTPGALFGGQGLAVAGSGSFIINAQNIDLGFSGGISVLAPNAPLAAISPYGANLTVTTFGNLEMTSTAIANYSLLGGITLNVGTATGGILDVGGPLTALGDPGVVKGIFTTSGGNISVNAGGNINVDGSRIAAYNGGNINLTSQTGDVNAGSGGSGFVSFQALGFNSAGQLVRIPALIPGSGILATTVPGSDAALGNITINTPNGSINASLGGILQLAFNGTDAKANFIDLNAGHDINAAGSGVIGYNINLQAGGNINGVIIGRQGVDIKSSQNVTVTVVSGGNVDINASGEVSGTVIGGGNVDVSGDSITASLIGESVSASGDTSGASMGIPQSNVTKENAETADDAATMASNTDDQDDENKKKGKGIALAQKTGRVTIVLPPKQQPKAQTPDPRT